MQLLLFVHCNCCLGSNGRNIGEGINSTYTHVEDRERGICQQRSFIAILKQFVSSLKEAASWFHSLALRESLALRVVFFVKGKRRKVINL